jgi:hypothetical protein
MKASPKFHCVSFFFAAGLALAQAPAPGGFPPPNAPGSNIPSSYAVDSEGYAMPFYATRYVLQLANQGRSVLSRKMTEERHPSLSYNPLYNEFRLMQGQNVGYTVTVVDAVPIFTYQSPHGSYPRPDAAQYLKVVEWLGLANEALYGQSDKTINRVQGGRLLVGDEYAALRGPGKDTAAFAMAALELACDEPLIGRTRAYMWLRQVGGSPEATALAKRCQDKILAALEEADRQGILSMAQDTVRAWALEEYKDILYVYDGTLSQRYRTRNLRGGERNE